MTTPPDPQGEGQQPDPGQYGQQPGQHGGAPPGQYGGAPPGQYGGAPPGQYPPQQYPPQQYPTQQYPTQQYPPEQAPYADPGQYGQPYGGPQAGGYPYGPYPTVFPAGLDSGGPAPAVRPGILVLSLVLLILSALPFFAFGALLLLVPLDSGAFPPEIGLDRAAADAGLTVDMVVAGLRAAAVVVLLTAILYIVFAIVAFQGRNWARIVLTIMTVGFALLILLGVLGGAGRDPISLIVALAILAATVGGTVLLYLAASNRFFASPRR